MPYKLFTLWYYTQFQSSNYLLDFFCSFTYMILLQIKFNYPHYSLHGHPRKWSHNGVKLILKEHWRHFRESAFIQYYSSLCNFFVVHLWSWQQLIVVKVTTKKSTIVSLKCFSIETKNILPESISQNCVSLTLDTWALCQIINMTFSRHLWPFTSKMF